MNFIRRAELKPQISDLHSHTRKPETLHNWVLLIFEGDRESDFHLREMHLSVLLLWLLITYLIEEKDKSFHNVKCSGILLILKAFKHLENN